MAQDKTLQLVGTFRDEISKSLRRVNQTLQKTKRVLTDTKRELNAVERQMKALRKVSAQHAKDYGKLSKNLKNARQAAHGLNVELKNSNTLYGRVRSNASRGLKHLGGAFSGAFTGALAGLSVGGAVSGIAGGLWGSVTDFIGQLQNVFQRSTNFLRAQIGKGSALQSETISSANTMLTMADSITSWDQAMQTSADSIGKMAKLAASLPGATSDYTTIFNGVLDDQIDMFGSVEGVLKNVDERGKESFTALLALSGQMSQIRPEMLLMDIAQFRQGQSIRNIQFIARNPLLQKKLTETYAQMLGTTSEAFEKLSPAKQSAEMKKLGVKGRMEALYEALQVSITPDAVAAMEKSWDGVTEGIRSTFLDPSSGLFGFGRRLKDGTNITEKLSATLAEMTKPVMAIVSAITGSSLDPLELLGTVINEIHYRSIQFGRKFNESLKAIFGDLDPVNIRSELGKQSGRLKFAEVIGKSLAELINGVATMVGDILSGKAGSSSLTEPLHAFIASVKANLDYDAINVALHHLIEAGAALLLEYEGLKAKFIREVATAAVRGAGAPQGVANLVGEATSAMKSPLGFMKAEYEGQQIYNLLAKAGLVGVNAKTSLATGRGIANRNPADIDRAKKLVENSDLTAAELQQIRDYYANGNARTDFERALHESGLFDGSPPYLRTIAYDSLPELININRKGNAAIRGEVRKINAGIAAMASSSLSIPGGGGMVKPSGDESHDSIKKKLLEVFGGNRNLAAGVWGNIMQESGGNPSAVNSIGASGLFQHLGGRANQLKAFAAQRGTPWNDAATQIEFMMHELRTSEGQAYAKLKEAVARGASTGEIAVIFRKYFERPGEHEAHDARRIAAANSFAGGNLDPLRQELRNMPRGAQLAYANTHEAVLNPDQTKMVAQAMSSNGNTYNITIHTPASDSQSIADSVIMAIDSRLEQRRRTQI